MEITTTQLLHSAQNFIRRRESFQKEAAAKATGESSFARKVLELTENLKNIQDAYTREQIRLQYLTEKPDAVDETLKYNNQELFPELRDNLKKEDILERTKKRLEELKLVIKKLEIEQENYFAIQFVSPSSIDVSLLNTKISNLSPERVNQLTRNLFIG